jgi:tetratricopeptide (TPR) repeat protein
MPVAFAHGLVSLWLGAASSAAAADQLPTLAAASLRPVPCRAQAREQQSALWSQTAGGAARAFCEAMARGQIRLEREPERALSLADQARSLLPGDASPLVLGARALVRLGDFTRAYQRFSESQTKQGQPFTDAAALREFAVAAGRTGRTEQALALYRKLIPRSDFGHAPTFRRLVVLEAVSLFGAAGPAGLADAEVYLTEVRRGAPAPGLEDLTAAFLALTYDRLGNFDQARVVIDEIGGPWGLERFLTSAEAARVEESMLPGTPNQATPPAPAFRSKRPSLAEGELHAALAVVAAESDPKLARVHLQAFLDGPGHKGPWGDWGRARLAAARGPRK